MLPNEYPVTIVRDGKMAQWVKGLLYKPEFDPDPVAEGRKKVPKAVL